MQTGSVDCCITSPPYYLLRNYGVFGQIGLEPTPGEYIAELVGVFKEVRRVLKSEGTLWLNIGDSYCGSGKGAMNFPDTAGDKQRTNKGAFDVQIPPTRPTGNLKKKDLIGIPWMLAFALREAGWYLRQDIIWHKANPMPESVTDRCTKAHEYIFLLSKSPKYYFDYRSIQENSVYLPGDRKDKKRGEFGGKYYNVKHISESFRAIREKRNKRDVWTIPTSHYRGAHFATFPEELVRLCLLAGCPEGGVVLDPFSGSGTVGVVCAKYNREFIGIELNEVYCRLAQDRIANTQMELELN